MNLVSSALMLGALLLGLLFLYAFARAVLDTIVCRRWPSTQGVVLRSGIGPYSTAPEVGLIHAEPQVEYQYQVNGETYTGRNLTIGGEMYWGTQAATQVSRRFKAGTSVVVHYDPRQPARAAIDTAFSSTLWVFLCLGILFAGVGILYLYGILRGWFSLI